MGALSNKFAKSCSFLDKKAVAADLNRSRIVYVILGCTMQPVCSKCVFFGLKFKCNNIKGMALFKCTL